MPLTDDELAAAVAVLAAGGLVAFPTETVYGLGADATNTAAVREVFAAKGRPLDHPLIVHLGDASGLDAIVREPSAAARTLAARHWPGPLTLILERRPDAVVDAVTGGRSTVGVRVPAHPVATGLLSAFGRPVAAPSANPFGRVSPTSAAEVREELGGACDLVLDGGPSAVGIESTIVDCTGPEPEILRVGGVTEAELATSLGTTVARRERPTGAPGTLDAHYAPRVPLQVCDAADLPAVMAAAGSDVGLIGPAELVDGRDGVLGAAESDEHYARELYRWLRAGEARGVDRIVAILPDDAGLGAAVRDRLVRASRGAAEADG